MYQKTLWEQLRQDLKEKFISSYDEVEKTWEKKRIMSSIEELKANHNWVAISMSTYTVLYLYTMNRDWLHPSQVFVR